MAYRSVVLIVPYLHVYVPNFVQIGKKLCGLTDGRNTGGRTLRPASLDRLYVGDSDSRPT